MKRLFKTIIIFLLTNFLIALVLSIVYAITRQMALSYFITYFFTLICLLLINKTKLIEDFQNIKKDYKGKLIKVIGVTIIFYLLMYVSNYLLVKYVGNLSLNEESARELYKSSPILMFITMGIFAPIVEELITRYPYRDLNINKYVKFFTYTLIFALMHLTGVNSLTQALFIIPYLFLSLEFSYNFFKTNNIYGSIIIHIINNSITLFLLLLV